MVALPWPRPSSISCIRVVPAFLDAACFALPDPIVGDRIFAAVGAKGW